MLTGDIVTKKILQLLMSGIVSPGAKLPTAQFFANEAGVSIVTAREAIKKLQTIGLLEVIHGRGIFATKWNGAVADLFEAREFYECNNLVAAAGKITKRGLGEFESVLSTMSNQVQAKDLNGYIQSHFEFHSMIAIYTENSILIRAFENIKQLFLFQTEILNRYPGVIERSYPEHIEIYEQIKNKKPQLAKMTMTKHIKNAQKSWENHIKIDPFKKTM